MASSTYRPIIAALETTFTPPAACFTSLEAYTDRNTALLVPLGVTAPITAYYSCFPPGYSAFLASNPGSGGIGAFYSPGICPSGFTSACAVSSDLVKGESAALCCPSNYGCFSGTTGVYTGLSCSSTIVSETVVTHYTPNFSVAGWQSDGKVTLPTDGTTMALGYGIEVRWQSSDLSVFAGATRTKASSPTPTNTGSRGAVSSSSISSGATATSASSSRGISPGTTVALGLGIPIVVILVALIIIALVLIRRKKRARNTRDSKRLVIDRDSEAAGPAELQGDGELIPPKVELNARTPSPVEIDGTRVPSPSFQTLRRPGPMGGDSGYGSSQGSRHRPHWGSEGRRVSDTYTISPVEPGRVGSTVSGPPASHPSTRRARSHSRPENSSVSPVSPEGPPHRRTASGGSNLSTSPPSSYPGAREGRHRRSGSENRKTSDAVSPVESNGGGTSTVSRIPSAARRSSIDDRPPPVPPIPAGHRSRSSGSRNRRGSDAHTVSSVEPSSGPISSPPASVRRPSMDGRSVSSVPVVRRPVPPRAPLSEASSGTSEEEREIAERYRMLTSFGA